MLTLGGCAEALTLRGLNNVATRRMPEIPFFGTLKIVVNTQRPWAVDLGNGQWLDIEPYNSATTPYDQPPQALFKLYDSPRGVTTEPSLIAEERVAVSDAFTGITLHIRPETLTVYANNASSIFGSGTPLLRPLAHGEKVSVYAPDEKCVQKFESNFETYPEAENVRLDEVDTEGTRTGYWTYLDRVTPTDGSVLLGARYVLALIADSADSDSYLLLYVSGNDTDSVFWKEGDVKGRLTPTAFQDHYNLEWYDHRHLPVGEGENSATFEGPSLLTLDFPLLAAQLRFQRTDNP